MQQKILMVFLSCLGWLAGCSTPMDSLQRSEIGFQRDAPAVPVSPYQGARWHVILDAVGNEEKVFDNFVNDFAAELRKDNPRIASLKQLSSSAVPAATAVTLFASLQQLRMQPKDACLLYLTGHGAQNKGIVFSAHKPKTYLAPEDLGKLLDGSKCAGQPTVVVVSSCFSGVYMKTGIANPNRIVITASAPDLPSFGCSDNRKYTFFDQCFLEQWRQQGTWEQLGDGLQQCVRSTERALRSAASRPQFFYGRNMRALDLPKPVADHN